MATPRPPCALQSRSSTTRCSDGRAATPFLIPSRTEPPSNANAGLIPASAPARSQAATPLRRHTALDHSTAAIFNSAGGYVRANRTPRLAARAAARTHLVGGRNFGGGKSLLGNGLSI
jgi:hypothetical protein